MHLITIVHYLIHLYAQFDPPKMHYLPVHLVDYPRPSYLIPYPRISPILSHYIMTLLIPLRYHLPPILYNLSDHILYLLFPLLLSIRLLTYRKCHILK